jgi:hypothetical protein
MRKIEASCPAAAGIRGSIMGSPDRAAQMVAKMRIVPEEKASPAMTVTS